jgi:hypothetical protein
MRSIFVAAAFAASSLVTSAAAQGMSCAPRDVVVERLNVSYGEVFNGGGLQNGAALFEVWVSQDDGTWTILMTRADGMSCIMAAGTDWLPPTDAQQVGGIKS